MRKFAYTEIAECLRDFVQSGAIELDHLDEDEAEYVEHVILEEVVPHFDRFTNDI